MQSPEAQVLRDTHLLIWDEAPTMDKHCFEAVDRLFRDLMRNNIPFGGKISIIQISLYFTKTLRAHY